MTEKPKNLQEMWTEAELCKKLGLPITTTVGRSMQLNNWIKGGLQHVEKSGRRYFFEQDVIDYLWQTRNKSVTK